MRSQIQTDAPTMTQPAMGQHALVNMIGQPLGYPWGEATHGGLARWLRLATLAVVLGVALALWVGVAPALPGAVALTTTPTGGSLRAQIAQACGIGAAPTMRANKVAALAYPSNGGVQQQQLFGTFPLAYLANQPISFYEDFSRVQFAPSPNSFTWRWNFGDGSTDATTVSVSHTFTQTGTYTVEADIYISGSWSLFDNAQIHIVANTLPNPPVAKAVALTSATITLGQSITLDGAGSHPVVGSQLTYAWNFGDNTSGSGERVTHQFTSPGLGVATLIVTDARGAQSMATVNIAIGQPGAKVQANVNRAQAGTAFTFNATDPGLGPGPNGVAQLTDVAWDFGDGTATLITKTTSASHSFAKAGAYTVAARLLNTDASVFVAKLVVVVTAAAGAAGAGGANWLLLGGGSLALLAVIGIALYLWLAQQRKLALAQQRAARNRPGGRGGAGQIGQLRGQPGAPQRGPSGRQGPPVPAARRLGADRPGMSGASGASRSSPASPASSGNPPRPRGAGAPSSGGGYPNRPARPYGAYDDDGARQQGRAPNSGGNSAPNGPRPPQRPANGHDGYSRPGDANRPAGYRPPRRDDYDD